MTTQNSGFQLVWLRRDLRSRDNQALFHASEQGPVICVWFAFPEQWQQHNDSPNKIWFWQENLKTLQNNLEGFNIPLITRNLKTFADATAALLEIAQSTEAAGLWFNDEYGIHEQQRDGQVEQAFLDTGIPCNRYPDDVLMPPGKILNKQGQPFKVFTPFRKAVYARLSPQEFQPLPAPQKQKKLSKIPASDPLATVTPTAQGISQSWPAGEKSAHEALHDFISERSAQYKSDRDYPNLNGTSCISPWLTAGTLSIRQCFSAGVVANNGELDTGSPGIVCWLSELIWREFYRHILVQFPHVSRNRAFQRETDRLPWKHDQKLYKAWKEAKTGVPIVDAAMRQLVSTGWMHNRLRMVTAMYLSKDLRLDWRLGETFFMEHLLDGDLASNNGGWQWAASTGTDAAPYFRMFNPVSQSEKFDPGGAFLRQWLPELKEMDNKSIHAPAASGSLFYDNSAYPKPIVDHKIAREATLAAFKKLKDGK